MANADTTRSECKYCKEDIRKDASICHHCGKFQEKWKNWAIHYIPVALVFIGTVIAATQAVDASREAARAKEAIDLTKSLKSEIELTADEVARVATDANTTASEVKALFMQRGLTGQRIGELRSDYLRLSDDIQTTETSLTSSITATSDLLGLLEHRYLEATTEIDTKLGMLDARAQESADLVYANELATEFGDIPWIYDITRSCDFKYSDTSDKLRLSTECLRDILRYRENIANGIHLGGAYQDKMSEHAWKRVMTSRLCYRIRLAARGPLAVGIDAYVNDNRWRLWAGFAQNVLNSTRPYVEDAMKPGALCDPPDISGLATVLETDAPRIYFGGPELSRVLSNYAFESLNTIEILPPYEIRFVSDDRVDVIYEWQLNQDPKVRQEN